MGNSDLINFDVIEGHKENIQALPSGRSARRLAEALSPVGPSSHGRRLASQDSDENRTANENMRDEFEAEIALLDESDDPLDIFERYVQWTLDTFPSAQATPQAGLHTLLERATKTFVSYPQYKNDPRYLKLWMLYVQFFADKPRETFIYLSRHGIGDSLALFYEAYAAWLEGSGRWTQAAEVYKIGIERETRPTARLLRKRAEFEMRFAAHQAKAEADGGPSSPALPCVRPALAAKIDPFGATTESRDLQAPRPNLGLGGGASRDPRPARQKKLAIFSDTSADSPADSASVLGSRGPGSKGWETIGSMAQRKKENTIEPKPWAGEVLKAGGKKMAGASEPKISVFRDPSKVPETTRNPPNLPASRLVILPSEYQISVNPNTGRKERVYVDLALLYPGPDDPDGEERCFEEVWAADWGILDVEPPDLTGAAVDNDSSHHDMLSKQQVGDESHSPTQSHFTIPLRPARKEKLQIFADPSPFSSSFSPSSTAASAAPAAAVHPLIDENAPIVDENGRAIGRSIRDSRQRTMEVNETLVVQTAIEAKVPVSADNDETISIVAAKTKTRRGYYESNETQTIKTKLDSPTGSRMIRRKFVESNDPTLHTLEAEKDIYDIYNDPNPQRIDPKEDFKSYELTQGDFTTSIPDGSVPPARTHSPVRSVTSEWSDYNPNEHGLHSNVDRTGAIESVTHDESHTASPTTDDEYEDEVTSPQYRTRTLQLSGEVDAAPESIGVYRDATGFANRRLPFMTPITERTESSFAATTIRGRQLASRQVARARVYAENDTGFDVDDPDVEDTCDATTRVMDEEGDSLDKKAPFKQAPVVNPTDHELQVTILESLGYGIASQGFHDYRQTEFSQLHQLIKWHGKTKRKSTTNLLVLNLPGASYTYTVLCMLGSGTFASVYLVERNPLAGQIAKGHHKAEHKRLLALKVENSPPSAWEFYMLHLIHLRLGNSTRVTQSITTAMDLYYFQNASIMLLPLYKWPTLINVANYLHGNSLAEETIVMFFTIELLRTLEALHSYDIMHGDLKVDNCFLRLDTSSSVAMPGNDHRPSTFHSAYSSSSSLDHPSRTSQQVSAPLGHRYYADGTNGWAERGIMLIDLGHGIDMRNFRQDVQFVVKWKEGEPDFVRTQKGRPFTYELDYYGLADIVHCLLFGKYVRLTETTAGHVHNHRSATTSNTTTKYRRPVDSVKRYWQQELWDRLFDVLLNPIAAAAGQLSHNGESGWCSIRERGGKMPLSRNLRAVRLAMEEWLEANYAKGLGLKNLMTKIEVYAGQLAKEKLGRRKS